MKQKITKYAVVLLLSLMIGTEACSFFSAPKQTRFRHQEDAATVQVAIQSVAPFEDYISTLEPKFDLTSDQALQIALAQTQSEDSQIFRALLANASVSVPTNAVAAAAGVTGASGATGAMGATGGTGSTGAAGNSPLPSAVTNALGALSLPAPSVDFNQSLRFRAAAALLQEVSLLTHYVRDAAVRTGTRPYIVRMLVTVLPFARNEPYDAYTTVSFFTGNNDGVPAARSSAFDRLSACLPRTCPEQPGCQRKPVDVLPLLVTDDIESSLHSNTSEVLRDLAAALQATQGNTGFAAGLRNHAEDLDKTLNRNLNSIYALGQAAPNAVQVRLGAAFANGKYVTVARTYSVSVLLLVKTCGTKELLDSEIIPCPAIAFKARTRIRDAVTGSIIDDGNDRVTNRQLEQFAASARIAHDIPAGTLRRWVDLAGSGDFDAFTKDVAAVPGASTDVTGLWTEAVTAAQASGRSAGEFVVDIPKVSLPNSCDHFSVFDDGQSSVLAINHAANVLPDRLYATLKVQLPNRWLFLTNDSVAVGPYGRTATFRFSSVKKTIDNDPLCKKDPAGVKPDPCPIENVYSEVVYDRGIRSWQSSSRDEFVYKWFPVSSADNVCRNAISCVGSAACAPPTSPPRGSVSVEDARTAGIIAASEVPIPYFVTAKPDSPTPDFTMALTAHQILASRDGTGEIVLAFRSKVPAKPAEIHFRVSEGGFIDSVIPDPSTLKVQVVGPDRVVSDGLYKLELKNLVPGSQVTVHAFRPGDGGGEIPAPDETAHVVSAIERATFVPRP